MPIQDLVLTNIGMSKALTAIDSGMYVNITQFAVGDGTAYTPNSGDTALHGTELFRATFDDLDIYYNQFNKSVYRCVVDETSTFGTVGEIGLYLDTGELFALGVLTTPYVKTTTYRLKIYCTIAPPHKGTGLFNLISRTTLTLPTVNNYVDLPPANVTSHSAYIVLNGHCGNNSEFTTYAPVLVCKYAMGDQWAVVNGSKIVESNLASVEFLDSSATEFVVATGNYLENTTPKINGATKFKLTGNIPSNINNMDIAMATVISGYGKYETRQVMWVEVEPPKLINSISNPNDTSTLGDLADINNKIKVSDTEDKLVGVLVTDTSEADNAITNNAVESNDDSGNIVVTPNDSLSSSQDTFDPADETPPTEVELTTEIEIPIRSPIRVDNPLPLPVADPNEPVIPVEIATPIPVVDPQTLVPIEDPLDIQPGDSGVLTPQGYFQTLDGQFTSGMLDGGNVSPEIRTIIAIWTGAGCCGGIN